MQAFESFVKIMNDLLWGVPMMVVLLGFGVLATIYLGFPQFSKLKLGWQNSFGQLFSQKNKNKEGSMSSFQSLATAVAAQVGTGNIGGVGGAILTGGPGAIFWMWMTALLGMGTIFVEAVLAQRYRQTREGELVAGPAYYISKGLEEHGLKGLGKVLAAIFAVLIILALGLVGNAVQSNSISSVMTEAFSLPTLKIGFEVTPALLIGLILATLAALVFVGGMKRIAKFTELVVPIMALIYIIGAIAMLVKFSNHIIPTIGDIFSAAFTPKAVLGGAVGYSIKTAIRYGVARGLFSNEAGMGSTPNSHGVADVPHPVIQGSVAMIGVFIDTIVVCTATALIILVSGANLTALENGYQGAQVTMQAFIHAFGDLGGQFLAISLLFFAFTTVIGWYYFGESNIKYLFKSKAALRIYQVLVILFIIVGTTIDIAKIWEVADMMNGLMVIPNVIGLIFLVRQAKKILDDYNEQVNLDEQLHFDYPYEGITESD